MIGVHLIIGNIDKQNLRHREGEEGYKCTQTLSSAKRAGGKAWNSKTVKGSTLRYRAEKLQKRHVELRTC
jgi:hypothetical protein